MAVVILLVHSNLGGGTYAVVVAHHIEVAPILDEGGHLDRLRSSLYLGIDVQDAAPSLADPERYRHPSGKQVHHRPLFPARILSEQCVIEDKVGGMGPACIFPCGLLNIGAALQYTRDCIPRPTPSRRWLTYRRPAGVSDVDVVLHFDDEEIESDGEDPSCPACDIAAKHWWRTTTPSTRFFHTADEVLGAVHQRSMRHMGVSMGPDWRARDYRCEAEIDLIEMLGKAGYFIVDVIGRRLRVFRVGEQDVRGRHARADEPRLFGRRCRGS